MFGAWPKKKKNPKPKQTKKQKKTIQKNTMLSNINGNIKKDIVCFMFAVLITW